MSDWRWQHRCGATVAHIVDAELRTARTVCGGTGGPGVIRAEIPIRTPKPELMDALRREAVTLCPACLEQEPLLDGRPWPIYVPFVPEPPGPPMTVTALGSAIRRLLRIQNRRKP